MRWQDDLVGINWQALSKLYRIAPLGEKSPEDLKVCFANSMFRCFVFDGERLIGAGRAVITSVR